MEGGGEHESPGGGGLNKPSRGGGGLWVGGESQEGAQGGKGGGGGGDKEIASGIAWGAHLLFDGRVALDKVAVWCSAVMGLFRCCQWKQYKSPSATSNVM